MPRSPLDPVDWPRLARGSRVATNLDSMDNSGIQPLILTSSPTPTRELVRVRYENACSIFVYFVANVANCTAILTVGVRRATASYVLTATNLALVGSGAGNQGSGVWAARVTGNDNPVCEWLNLVLQPTPNATNAHFCQAWVAPSNQQEAHLRMLQSLHDLLRSGADIR